MYTIGSFEWAPADFVAPGPQATRSKLFGIGLRCRSMIASVLSRARRSGILNLVLLATFASAAEPPEIKSPLEPKESLRHFQLDPGLKIELAAAEPQVVDPVSIRF